MHLRERGAPEEWRLPERNGDTSEEAAQSGGFQERCFGLSAITNGDGDLYPSRDGRDGRGRHEQE